MSSHFEDYLWAYFAGVCFLILFFSFTVLSTVLYLKEDIIQACSNVDTVNITTDEPVDVVCPVCVSSTSTEPSYEQEQITKLQEDNLWCFAEKKKLEDNETILNAEIVSLQETLKTKIDPTECAI